MKLNKKRKKINLQRSIREGAEVQKFKYILNKTTNYVKWDK